MQTVPVFCGKDCGGNACPLMAEIENGRVLRVSNNPAGGKYLKGCRKGFNLPSELYSEGRILEPLVRIGERGSGKFRKATWEEALRIIAEKLGEIRDQFGANSILNLSSAGSTAALHNTTSLLQRFLNLLGGSTILTGSYSNGAARFVLPYVLGKEWSVAGWDAATMRYSEMIILWGANILEARLGTEVAPRVLEARQRGARIVVIDPRRSETVKRMADWWIPCRPGTDAALMLAVLYVLIHENQVDHEFMEKHSIGFEKLKAYILGIEDGVKHNPEWAERICGVQAEEIERFARSYASAKPAMLFPGFSIQRVYAGEETYRLTVALQLATGNFGLIGGSTGALNNRLPAPRVGKMSAPPITGVAAVPDVRWPDAVLEGRQGDFPSDIHAIYTVGGNYLNQGGDIHKSIRAFQKVDFSVSHEMVMTATARFSDIVLPVTHTLEREDIGIPWLGNYLTYKPQAVPVLGQARTDFEIFCDLADHFGFEAEYSEGRNASEWIQHFLDQSEITDQEAFRKTGVYFGSEQERVGLSDFRENPASYPLSTASGKVEISCMKYKQETGFSDIPTWQEPFHDTRFPLLLITPKSPFRTHSQGGDLSKEQSGSKHVVEINPGDAALRGISDGEIVEIFNEYGRIRIAVRYSDDLMPGVVCLLEGVWVELDDLGFDRAGSANILTSTNGTRPSQSCIMSGIGVEVRHATDL